MDDARTRFAMRAAGLGVWELVLETRAVYWSETLEEVAAWRRNFEVRTTNYEGLDPASARTP